MFIVAPNSGTSLDSGGGSFVTLVMAIALSKLKETVYLVALRGLGRNQLVSHHEIELPANIRLIYLDVCKANYSPRRDYFRLVPFLSQLIKKLKPSLIIWNDDAPR